MKARNRTTKVLTMAMAVAMLGQMLIAAVGLAENRVDEWVDRLTIHVPRDARTIQEAINVVPDGGTVKVAPGTYRETLDIVGKRVNLVGDGRKGTRRTLIIGELPRRFVQLNETRGLINYGPGGGGRLSNLTLIGGDVGVRGLGEDRGAAPAAVTIDDVSLLKNGRGVAGRFSQLKMSTMAITGGLIHGVSLTCAELLEMYDIFVGSVTWGWGAVIFNQCDAPPHVAINNGVFSSNSDGGAAFIGDMDVDITDTLVTSNGAAGLLFVGVGDATVFATTVEGHDGGILPGVSTSGMGIIALNSPIVRILSSQVINNSGQSNSSAVGVLTAGGSEVRFAGTDVTANNVGIVVQMGLSGLGPCGTFVDIGNNNLTGNTQDLLFDSVCGGGNVPVPEAPPIPEG